MRIILSILAIFTVLMASSPAMSYMGLSLGEGTDCSQCHTLSFDEATEIVKSVNSEIEVMEIKTSPVAGLWEITIMARGKRGIAYIDYPKSHIITGSIIDISNSLNLTNDRLYEISKVEFSDIPLEDALILGNPDARFKAIVFHDPDCAYCKNLHREMKTLVAEYEDIAFYIKMLPLKRHPEAYKKAKAIVCLKSIALLERSFDGRTLPEPACETTEVDDTIELAERLGIASTPTIILPDGGVVQGYKDRETLLDLIETSGRAVEEMIAARQAEIEAERIRKLIEMEKKDFALALLDNSINSYHEFLGKYPNGKKRLEVISALSALINLEDNRLALYRDYIHRYPDALEFIPEEHRLLYVGPGEFPVYEIIQRLSEGMSEDEVATRIGSIIGRYKEFTVEEAQRLLDMGITDTVVDAMLEATFMAKRREAEQKRQEQTNALLEEMDLIQASIYDMEATMEQRHAEFPELPEEAITDEIGTPLAEKIERCQRTISALEDCKRTRDIAACQTIAVNEFPCQ